MASLLISKSSVLAPILCKGTVTPPSILSEPVEILILIVSDILELVERVFDG